jgi:UDP-3-O-[3-hydroxymyristoyl] glucosamine N-acyltransferase
MSKRLDFIRSIVSKRGINEIHRMIAGRKYVIKGYGCNIQEGVTIGLDGFGYEPDEDGVYVKFPHYGKIIIGHHVDILSPTVVCRGSMNDTIIGDGCKIAGNCQIGHNTSMGENCLIGPFTCVGGSARLGNNVRTGQFVYIAHGVTIGDDVDVSSFTYVSKDVPSGAKVRGIPGVSV